MRYIGRMNYFKTSHLRPLWLAIALFSYANYAQASTFFRLEHDWKATLKNVLEQSAQPSGPISELRQPSRSVRATYWQSQPYKLRGDSGEAFLKDYGRAVTVGWPLTVKGHLASLRFSIEERESEGVAAGYDSRIKVSESTETMTLALAHRWDALQLRWGAEFKWIYQNTTARIDPRYEIGWGADAGTRFQVSVYRRTLRTDWHWRVESDSLVGQAAGVLDGGAFELSFGEPFGLRMTVSFADEQIRRMQPNDQMLNLTTSGERNGVSVRLDKPAGKRPGWSLNLRRWETSGDAFLRENEQVIGDAQVMDIDETGFGGEISGMMPGRIRWLCEGSFDRLDAVAGGSIRDLLPGKFNAAISGGRIFATESFAQGPRFSVKVRGERNRLRGSLETGYADYSLRVLIQDRHRDSDEIRLTRLPVSGVSLGWGTAELEINYRNILLTGNVSQAVVIDQRGTDESSFGGNARLTGGWIASSTLSYKF